MRHDNFKRIESCRICGNVNLVPIIDLGVQSQTGIFPKTSAVEITRGPLELVKCHSEIAEQCGLVQLAASYEPSELYGDNYGYRSGLNQTMVRHLEQLVARLRQTIKLAAGDLVIDVGSNDGTLLSFYPPGQATLVGIDPTGTKFRRFYRNDIQLISDFFSAAAVRDKFGGRKVRVVTSVAMFYDLERPTVFASEVAEVLADDGVWTFEQSYLPAMLETNSYDTICHEHLEYYAMRQIKWIIDRAGLKIIDVTRNDSNGGSFAVTASKIDSKYPAATNAVAQMIEEEDIAGLNSLDLYAQFQENILTHKNELKKLLKALRQEGKRVLGYGASTKGNVILQYCELTAADVPCIADVNPDKFGHVTPGTHIPIISEAAAHAMNPDYFLVLPWHFRQNLIARESEFLKSGGRMIFPLPKIGIVEHA